MVTTTMSVYSRRISWRARSHARPLRALSGRIKAITPSSLDLRITKIEKIGRKTGVAISYRVLCPACVPTPTASCSGWRGSSRMQQTLDFRFRRDHLPGLPDRVKGGFMIITGRILLCATLWTRSLTSSSLRPPTTSGRLDESSTGRSLPAGRASQWRHCRPVVRRRAS